ncbi:MAG: hypothetical protein ACOYUK_01475 [Patescibacteria group bacterium]
MSFFEERGISTFWGISIILMEVVVVFFVFYILYFFWIENPTPTDNILIIRSFRNSIVRIPETVDTTGWLQYQSDETGISFQYPSSDVVSEDTIVYGDAEGRIVELISGQDTVFALKAFPLAPDEQSDEVDVAKVFKRLTGVTPNIYQSYTEKIDGMTATVYRQVPGNPPQDHIYFYNQRYFFETIFSSTTAPILATVILEP